MHESRMGLKAPDETNPLYIVERSPPRRWGARLRLTGQRDTLAGRDDAAPIWLYIMGAPDDEAGSTTWPSYWGTAQGDPSHHLTELAGVAGWFELAADRCAWSLWIDRRYLHKYNHHRIKLKLNGLSPFQYRNQALRR